MNDTPSFLSRVRAQLPHFHPMERQLAEFVLDFPGDLASYAASELAALAGVSNATVSRFIKRLGYRHFDEARRHVRDAQQRGSPLFLARRDATDRHAYGVRVERSRDNLERTLSRLDPTQVDAIATALVQARRVWITGFRSSRSFAAYLRWQLFQVKEATELVPQAGDTLGQYTASMSGDDVVVVFALRRRPAGLDELLALIARTGARVLHISDEPLPPLDGLAWHLYCSCASDSPLDDHGAVIALCHLLASRVLELGGPPSRARLTTIEAHHDTLHEL